MGGDIVRRGHFFLAVSLIPGQGFWNWLHTFCFGLFGWCAYLIAPALIYIAVMAAMDKPMGALGTRSGRPFVLVALICGAAQIFAKTPMEGENFVEKAAYLYESGTKLKGGGLAAGLIGIPLLSFGKTPAAVTVFLLIFTFLMLITGATLLDLTVRPISRFKKSGKPMWSGWSNAAAHSLTSTCRWTKIRCLPIRFGWRSSRSSLGKR